MIRFIYADDLPNHPVLANSMYRDRAGQFHDRLAWDLTLDEQGHEKDQYDVLNPLYCIYELPDGTHGGSGRLMPTTGRNMYGEHFTFLSDGVEISSPLIWESTRFCASPRLSGGLAAAKQISTALMLAGCEVALRYGLSHYLAVFDAPMRRIYRQTGWAPEVIGEDGEGRNKLCLGLWEVSEAARQNIIDRLDEVPAMTGLPGMAAIAA
ncbi:acyl-homoserine-lactone synthase [Rhodovulum sp. DZ06]|uniref:acyl-homoserine-lactone synthase n=1 Tax=Rhodovulum sp. DZ06 TaxID=3425126 RepID=UPI003D33FDF0